MPRTSPKLTKVRKDAVVKAMSNLGVARYACEIALVPYDTHRQWMKVDPNYRQSMAQAEEDSIEVAEMELRRRALTGWNEPVYYKGKLVGEKRVYSDYCLGMLLRGAKPRKYRERASVELSGPGGGAIDIEISPKDVILQRLAGMRERADEVAEVERRHLALMPANGNGHNGNGNGNGSHNGHNGSGAVENGA